MNKRSLQRMILAGVIAGIIVFLIGVTIVWNRIMEGTIYELRWNWATLGALFLLVVFVALGWAIIALSGADHTTFSFSQIIVPPQVNQPEQDLPPFQFQDNGVSDAPVDEVREGIRRKG